MSIELPGAAVELQPWLVILGEAPDTELATWEIEANEKQALVMFSTKPKAESYAQQHCADPCQVVQFGQLELLQILIEAYSSGALFAVLDPSEGDASQVFRIKEVLAAAKKDLHSRRRDS